MQQRNIPDNIVLVQEPIPSRKEAREARLVIKLDMANTFDRVNHSFLFLVMEIFLSKKFAMD